MSGAVLVLTLMPFSFCEAMNKCEQPDGGFVYQQQPCADNTQSTTFSDQSLKSQNRQEEAVREANDKVLAAPPVSSVTDYGRVKPLAHVVEVGAQGGRAATASANPDAQIHGLGRLFMALFVITAIYAYLVWPFTVARWARYNGQSFIAWLLISWICSPVLSSLFLRLSDGPNTSPNRGKMWQRISVAMFFFSLTALSGAWDGYRANSAFEHYGHKAVVEPVREYTIEKTTYSDGTSLSQYVVDANFTTADGRYITATRILPQKLASLAINGGKVELTYLSNQPEKVRFEGEAMKPNNGLIGFVVGFFFFLLTWWMYRKTSATAAEVWK